MSHPVALPPTGARPTIERIPQTTPLDSTLASHSRNSEHVFMGTKTCLEFIGYSL